MLEKVWALITSRRLIVLAVPVFAYLIGLLGWEIEDEQAFAAAVVLLAGALYSWSQKGISLEGLDKRLAEMVKMPSFWLAAFALVALPLFELLGVDIGDPAELAAAVVTIVNLLFRLGAQKPLFEEVT
jgi:hypothetical protein